MDGISVLGMSKTWAWHSVLSRPLNNQRPCWRQIPAGPVLHFHPVQPPDDQKKDPPDKPRFVLLPPPSTDPEDAEQWCTPRWSLSVTRSGRVGALGCVLNVREKAE